MSASIADEAELILWRQRRARIDQALGQLLALQGDHADPDLINLQHDLTELGQPPFGVKQ